MWIRGIVLAGLGAAFVLASASVGEAQILSAAPPKVDEAVVHEVNSAAIAIAVGAQSIPAERMALGRRLVEAMNRRAQLERALGPAYAPTKARILQQAPPMPAQRRAKLEAAIDETLASLEKDEVDRLVQGQARYYAARLTPEQFGTVLEFYDTPLGRKTARAPGTMTQDHEVRSYILSHPTMLEFIVALPGSAEVDETLAAQAESDLGDRLWARLCVAAKTRGLPTPDCPAT